MNTTEKRLTVGVATMALLAGATVAMATHSAGTNGAPATITLKDATGSAVTGNTPYSPKMTCGMAAGACHDYGSGSTSVSKFQGYVNGSGKVAFDTYTVSTHTHGVSVGVHSSQGRGEEWPAALRTVWGAPAFASSPGMWGRY